MSSKLLKSNETSVGGGARLVSWRSSAMPGEAQVEHARPPEQTASEIIAAARGRAEAIIQEALEASMNISEEARRQGHAEGQAQGYDAGASQAKGLIDQAQEELNAALEQKSQMIVQAEQEIVALSLKIAALVIKREVRMDPESVLALVRDGLTRVRDDVGVTVRLNPVDAVVVRGNMNSLLTGTGVRQLSVEEDATMEAAGCIISTSRGEIDERIGSQMKRITTAFEGVERDGGI